MSIIGGRPGLLLKKNSPEILIAMGIVGVIGSTIMACRATTKAEKVLRGHKNELGKINIVWEKVKEGEVPLDEYTNMDHRKDLAKTYIETGIDLIKLYGPAVGLGLVSIGCIFASHGIMRSRNVALMAAYKAIEEGFTAYRKRVIDEYGEEKDYMFKHNLRSESINEIEVGPDGKPRKVKKTKLNSDDTNSLSVYARFFDESCAQWSKTPEYNLMFLRAQQNYHNDLLRTRGHVFLNEVYDALGIERTKAGAVVGWVIGSGDNFIDFGIFDGDRERSRAFVNGYEPSILLDFNVDGVIYDLI